MPAGPGGWQGQPNRGYQRHLSYAGQDVLLDLTFVDSTQTPQTPSAASWRMDDLTNVQPMVGETSFSPTGSTYTLQIPGSSMVMNRTWEGRQICQIWITATIPDATATSGSITVQKVVIVELIGIAVPC